MGNEILLAFSIGIYIVTLVGVSFYAFQVRKSSPFEPIGHYLFFVSLFVLPLPLRALATTDIEGNVSPFLPTILGYLPLALGLTSLSLPAFAAGYYSRIAGWLAQRLPHTPVHGPTYPFRAAFSLALLALLLIYLLSAEAGGMMAFILKGYNSSEDMFGKGYLAVGFPMSFIATLFILSAYAQNHSKARLVLFILSIVFVFGVHLLMGSRGQLMYFGLVLMTFYNFAIKPIRIVKAIPIIAIGFVALNIMGLARGSNYDSIDSFIDSFAKGAAAAGDEAGGHGLFYTLTVGEFVVPYESLPLTISLVDNDEPLLYGLSFIRAPFNIIPTAIFPDKPQPLSIWYMTRVYGASAKLNEGRQFFFLSEGYLNFGPFGVVLLALVWGVIWGTLQKWLDRDNNNFANILLYSLSTGFLFRCVAGDSVTVISGLPQQALLPAVLGILVMTNFRRWRAPAS